MPGVNIEEKANGWRSKMTKIWTKSAKHAKNVETHDLFCVLTALPVANGSLVEVPDTKDVSVAVFITTEGGRVVGVV